MSAISTRRGLIAGSASAVAAGALSQAGHAALQTDRELLDLLVAQEERLIAHYAAILDAFNEASFASAGLPGNTRGRIGEMLAAEEAHLDTVKPGRAPTEAASAPANLLDALCEAAERENTAVATYALVIPRWRRARLRPQIIGIHSVEARHAAWLDTLLGDYPFPATIDRALRLEEATAFITEQTVPAAATTGTARLDSRLQAAIAEELGVDVADLNVISVTSRTWPDTSLGCPQPDMVYAQVVTEGFLVVVEMAGERIEVHTDQRSNVVRCP